MAKENPKVGESLKVRITGDWMSAFVVSVDGRYFTVQASDGRTRNLVDTAHQTVQEKGWDLDRVAAARIANH